MPAVSESQRRLLFARFGSKWAHEHGFANKGKLPAHVKDRKGAAVASMRLGGGGRFKKLERSLGKQGIRNPGGLAAAIGRKKYSAKRFNKLAAAGRRRATRGGT